MNLTANEIAQKVNGSILGDGETKLTGFAKADAATTGDLTFAENEKFFRLAEQSQASAILAPAEFQSESKTVIQVKDARIAFAQVLPLFFPEKQFIPGVHPSAVVADSADIAETAHIGPNCVIGENVTIGDDAILEPHCTIGDNSALGQACHLFPNVSVYHGCILAKRVRIHSGTVIGSDGFGYVFDQDHHRKIPQIGGVIIEDDVEIGANCTVDRGALGDTKIGRGTKIDNLVQIGHNVIIGEHWGVLNPRRPGRRGGALESWPQEHCRRQVRCHQRYRGQPTIHGLPSHPRLGGQAPDRCRQETARLGQARPRTRKTT